MRPVRRAKVTVWSSTEFSLFYGNARSLIFCLLQIVNFGFVCKSKGLILVEKENVYFWEAGVPLRCRAKFCAEGKFSALLDNFVMSFLWGSNDLILRMGIRCNRNDRYFCSKGNA